MKLRNKLILSCAALAAVATTAVSTTFAWYTSNTEVTVNPLTAQTKNSGSDLLMIADGLTKVVNGNQTSYNDIAYADLNWDTKITNIVTTEVEMTPLAYNGKVKNAKYPATAQSAEEADTAGALKALAGNRYVSVGDAAYDSSATYYTRSGQQGSYSYDEIEFEDDADLTAQGAKTAEQKYDDAKANLYIINMGTDTATASDDSGYLKFMLYLKNGATTAKNITMTVTDLTNVTAATALPSKSIITPATNRANLGLANNSTATSYTVNALRVLAMDLEIAKVTNTEGTYSKVAQNETVYSLKSALASDFNFGDTLGTNHDAHAYYNSVMNPDLDTTDEYNQNTANFVSLGGSNGTTLNVQVPAAASADEFLQLTFKIYLNGWDKACFDACQNQQVTFGLNFEIPQVQG